MKSIKRILPFIVIGVFAGISVDAAAAESAGRPYIGGGVGYGRMNGEDFTNSNNDLTKSHVSWKALAGFGINNMLSLEGQYIDFGAANRSSDRIQATGWTAGVVLDFGKDKPITPYVKAGALFWNTDNRFNNISRSEDGTGLTFGVGVRFKLADNLALRTEYERFNMDHTDIDNFSAALQLNF